MAAALRSLQKLGSIGVAAAATTLSYNKPSACDQRRRFEGKTIVITGGGGTFGRVGAKYFAEEIGHLKLTMQPVDELGPGEVGYLIGSVKDVADTRVGGAVISPDGTLACFSVRQYCWNDKKFDNQLWIADLAAAERRKARFVFPLSCSSCMDA